MNLLKNSICMAVFLLSGLLSFGQKNEFKNIPKEIVNHFKSTYPNAKNIDADKEMNGTYEIDFDMHGAEWETHYSNTNAWVLTKHEIRKASLPQPVKEAISSDYAGWRIDDVEEHANPQYKSFYKVELEQKNIEKYVYFLPDGQLKK